MHTRIMMQMLSLVLILSLNCSISDAAQLTNVKQNIVTKPVATKAVTDGQRRTILKNVIKTRCIRDCVDAGKLQNAVKLASDTYEVSQDLVLSVISTESGFRNNAKSGTQDGLMQIVRGLHKERFRKLKEKNTFNVTSNVLVGTEILKECLDKRKGAIDKALACYNGGGDKHYVTKVRKNLTAIKQVAKDTINNKKEV
jgi:soluble lytic murein transglycosylase-like protein